MPAASALDSYSFFPCVFVVESRRGRNAGRLLWHLQQSLRGVVAAVVTVVIGPRRGLLSSHNPKTTTARVRRFRAPREPLASLDSCTTTWTALGDTHTHSPISHGLLTPGWPEATTSSVFPPSSYIVLCTSSSLVGLMSQMRSTTSSGMRVSALEPKARAGAVARLSHCRAIPGGLTFFPLFCTPCPCSGSGLLSLEPPLLRNPRHVSSERVACWPGISPFCSPSESSFLKRSFLPIWVYPARALWRFVPGG